MLDLTVRFSDVQSELSCLAILLQSNIVLSATSRDTRVGFDGDPRRDQMCCARQRATTVDDRSKVNLSLCHKYLSSR